MTVTIELTENIEYEHVEKKQENVESDNVEHWNHKKENIEKEKMSVDYVILFF